MNIILIGYRCSGKTSVGKRLSERWGIPFLDTDDLVEQDALRSIREIVAESGWETFRRMEREVIRGLSGRTDAVIAVGGGAVMDPESREALGRDGLFVWLMADAHTIVQRMRGDASSAPQRPPLSSHSLERETRELLQERSPTYRQLANISVDTVGRGVEAIVAEICRSLGLPESPLHEGKPRRD